MNYRTEKDLLGTLEISNENYYGIHTARALKNFPYNGPMVNLDLIYSIVKVKIAATEANLELKYLEKVTAKAIIDSCNEILDGKFNNQFPVSAMQGGAGTSTNMNVNEVIANRALEIIGKERGDYSAIHPIETVNLHQSTNDVYPTALKITLISKLRELSEIIAGLQGCFQKKEKEFSHIVTTGRTEMQNAVPITLGAQFASFAQAIERDRWRTFKNEERIRMVNIGGTAAGTGLTAPRDYIFLVIEKLRSLTGLGIARAEFVMDQTANADCYVEISGMLAANAVNLIKISKDIRILHFLNEITLPAVQAGSSIMPGKVNPVILESVISASQKVLSLNDLVIKSASDGSLQINEFMPLIAESLLESIDLLAVSNKILNNHVEQISASEEQCHENLDKSLMFITAFLPEIGYEKSEEILEEYIVKGKKGLFKDFLTEKLGDKLVKEVLSAANLTSLGFRPKSK